MTEPTHRAPRIALVGLSGVGKSTLAEQLRQSLTADWGRCTVLKLADPLYRLQRHYRQVAGLPTDTGQDQALLASIATELRRLSSRALLEDFVTRLAQEPPGTPVVNDDLRDASVDAPGLRAVGFACVRVTCPEPVRVHRLHGRSDASRIDERAQFGPDLGRIPVVAQVDTARRTIAECVDLVRAADTEARRRCLHRPAALRTAESGRTR